MRIPKPCGAFVFSTGVEKFVSVHDVLFVAFHVLLLLVVVGSGVLTFGLLAILTLSFNVIVVGYIVDILYCLVI
ncbi:hypothetical protein A2U01_0088938 [Trifolium medium]|uniref:Transmembrane protein n=1 Tax=Trifolium medium TaxID=97028 RepID=A0A392U2P2_9FABA|nr:hypothetical protein [Trifolium medium]